MIMSYLIILDWDVDFHPNKLNSAETEKEAQALISGAVGTYPNAFYVVNPEVDEIYIIVDPATKTITVDTAVQVSDAAKEAAQVEIERLERLQMKPRFLLDLLKGGGQIFDPKTDQTVSYRNDEIEALKVIERAKL